MLNALEALVKVLQATHNDDTESAAKDASRFVGLGRLSHQQPAGVWALLKAVSVMQDPPFEMCTYIGQGAYRLERPRRGTASSS